MSARHDYRGERPVRLLRALVEACEAVRRWDEAQIATYGLSGREFDCLVNLGARQPLRMCDLAHCSLLTKSHTTQVMKGLECRQLIRRERSPESDREVLAWLTPAGQELFERVYPVHYRFLQERFGSRLSDAEQEALIALLRQLVVSR